MAVEEGWCGPKPTGTRRKHLIKPWDIGMQGWSGAVRQLQLGLLYQTEHRHLAYADLETAKESRQRREDPQ
ncbi:hypothetical protein [Paenibacillus lemnae]|uniref:Uncharacterized protein n=1 Tax=Paenibacillus lemnae TaxID=1330551 RepID=A0A848M849_PAELE|nr:hypothetical protein [Paenibacillus lemnae]NMO96073.1 hypothetical protein [Paenibacillus lemnae]